MAVDCFVLFILRFENDLEKSHCLSRFLSLIEVNFPMFDIFEWKSNKNRHSSWKRVSQPIFLKYRDKA